MTDRPLRRRSRTSLAFLALGLAGTCELPAHAAAETLPYAIAIEVGPEDHRQSASLREHVERSILDAIAAKRCFGEVRRSGAPGSSDRAPDLILRVTLGEIQDEKRHDLSLAGSLDPNDPDAEMQYTVVLSIEVTYELLAPPAAVPVKRQHFRVQTERRPIFKGEDTRAHARDEMVSTLARRIASSACGISRKKLQKDLDSARAQGAPVPPDR